VDSRYTIAKARLRDISPLAAIERAAATLLHGHAPVRVLDGTVDESDLRQAQAGGRLWVALADDAPVGFAVVQMLAEDLPHLQEIDVDPQHGRRGIGAALVRTVCEWARMCKYAEITLTTFRDLRWNMPFYARLGFEEVPADDLRPELLAVVEEETRRGLDPQRRVVMRHRVGSSERGSTTGTWGRGK
jgi:GNAT superfamily N-acetyltransferase